MLVKEYIMKKKLLYDFLPFTTLLAQNFEVSYMTGSTLQILMCTFTVVGSEGIHQMMQMCH